MRELDKNIESLKWSFGHAETEIVAIWISHRKLAQSPGLINWRGVNWRLRTL
jgi:hypothetical protein